MKRPNLFLISAALALAATPNSPRLTVTDELRDAPKDANEVRELDPYSPCPCRSGKKRKFCHFKGSNAAPSLGGKRGEA